MAKSVAVVTGVAGFIGSHLADALCAVGTNVIGVDAFTDFYPRTLKERNLVHLRSESGFTLIEADIVDVDLAALARGADVIYHLAAQAGVRPSWGPGFDAYVRHNVLGTHRVLEAARSTGVRVVYSSSSSVYGDADCVPTPETAPLIPVSPYGATKLAGEHLCRAYWSQHRIPVISLRYFTVYGPRQRPDMAFSRFIHAALASQPLPLYGDGEQSRDFTYVGDAVEANLRAASLGFPGKAYNVAGGEVATITAAIAMIGALTGGPIEIARERRAEGDARHTAADVSLARADLGFAPGTPLYAGLTAQVEWARDVDRNSCRH
jgi:nucleoside-diphosphate-sugar epimerase